MVDVFSLITGLGIGIVFLILLALYTLLGLRVVNEYERGVKFTMGKFRKIMDPGLRIVFPVIQSWQRIDMRVKVIDVPDQETITKDNVSVKINAGVLLKL